MAYPRVAGTSEKTEAVPSPENAPFRAKLVSNAAVARRAASTLSSIAKRSSRSIRTERGALLRPQDAREDYLSARTALIAVA